MTSTPISHMSFNGLVVALRDGTCDKGVAASTIISDEYNIRTLAVPDAYFIDIGAYCGHASLLAASLGMTCIAVEPLTENIEIINENIRNNDAMGFGSIRVVKGAVGFCEIGWGSGDGSEFAEAHRFIGNGVGEKFSHAKTCYANEVTLDELLAGIEKVRILKTDCEGGEWKMFEEASPETLDKIEYIVGEIHAIDDRRLDDLMKLLPMFEPADLPLQQGADAVLKIFALKHK